MTNNILNKPYPLLLNRWKLTFLVSIFISFFLSVFQPFGIQFLEIENKTLILTGYGVVTFLVLLFDLFLIPSLLKKTFRDENWTVWKQIVWLTFIVLTISIGNYAYSLSFAITQWLGLQGVLMFVLFTLPIAIIPITVITFITQNLHLKRNAKLSAQLNEDLKDKATESESADLISFKSGLQDYSFPFNSVLFLESEGNYVQVYYIKNGQVKTQLIRNTLKNISAEIDKKDLFKCHRAFMINLNKVEKVEGNSHGIAITLSQIDRQIPVSRSNTKAFTELLEATKS